MNFGGIVGGWYEKNKRDLPWRRTRDPYLVWLSEVILQQTRVIQGIEYYNRFSAAFPDLTALASAPEERVLKLWQGLGYYNRARNMHQAARELVRCHGGKMPDSYEGLLAMKGVGSYTAAAVASICFGERKAVVDGNVSRVIARLFGVEDPVNGTLGRRTIDTLAGQLMEEGLGGAAHGSSPRGYSPGIHNQAMMEFGALQCVPVTPGCNLCPLSGGCNARLTNRVEKLPVKIPKRQPVDRWMYFYFITGNGETILTRRGEQGIWRSLYHFPVVERSEAHAGEEIPTMEEASIPGVFPVCSKVSAPIRHQLTHLTIHARFIHVELPSLPRLLPEKFIRIPIGELDQYPVPRLMERYMEVVKF